MCEDGVALNIGLRGAGCGEGIGGETELGCTVGGYMFRELTGVGRVV